MNELTLLGFGPEGWGDELLSGLLVTVQLAVTTLPLGLLIGFAVAGASLSANPGCAASDAAIPRRHGVSPSC
ncbi:hypothetical protein [Marinobacterium aestuariivivens]|uniref:ABC transmembrane type-1 domain-containing protein n=1 Tax=Marinobacterium aestuariivivens TaxID=1698799 RepID=A0ABW2A126_9GAMM